MRMVIVQSIPPHLVFPVFYQQISYIVFRLVNILYAYKMNMYFGGFVILLFSLGFKAPLKMPFCVKSPRFS